MDLNGFKRINGLVSLGKSTPETHGFWPSNWSGLPVKIVPSSNSMTISWIQLVYMFISKSQKKVDDNWGKKNTWRIRNLQRGPSPAWYVVTDAWERISRWPFVENWIVPFFRIFSGTITGCLRLQMCLRKWLWQLTDLHFGSSNAFNGAIQWHSTFNGPYGTACPPFRSCGLHLSHILWTTNLEDNTMDYDNACFCYLTVMALCVGMCNVHLWRLPYQNISYVHNSTCRSWN